MDKIYRTGKFTREISKAESQLQDKGLIEDS